MSLILDLKISNILLLYIWCILINTISYTEELILSLIYIVLFIIISENSRNIIKTLIVKQTLKLMLCYEQLIYLKKKLIIKSVKLQKILLQKKFIKNIINLMNFEVKQKNKNNVDNKKKINNIIKFYYLFCLLLSKINNK